MRWDEESDCRAPQARPSDWDLAAPCRDWVLRSLGPYQCNSPQRAYRKGCSSVPKFRRIGCPSMFKGHMRAPIGFFWGSGGDRASFTKSGNSIFAAMLSEGDMLLKAQYYFIRLLSEHDTCICCTKSRITWETNEWPSPRNILGP